MKTRNVRVGFDDLMNLMQCHASGNCIENIKLSNRQVVLILSTIAVSGQIPTGWFSLEW